ncbi:cell adhesion molecule Dscam2-like isoform X3 [Rhodnius prolixus]|uniref:cell adhesion molecule Dscam2-like isoform X3 n=1 Tax=Rhodnius prolixus TaxID=13249 RepID=UPI003D18B448
MAIRMTVTTALIAFIFVPLDTGFGESSVGPSWIREPWPVLHVSNSTGGHADCQAAGYPQPTVSWKFADGKPVTTSPGVLEILSNGTLSFPPFRPSAYRHDLHAATYRCYASNTVGTIVSRDVRVRAVVLQYVEVQVESAKSYHRGNTALLKCVVPSFLKEFISITSWLQDSSFNIYPSIKGDGKYHMLPSGDLLVRRVDDADVYRSYQCRVINRLTGETLLSPHRVRFLVTDTLVHVAPRIADSPASIHAKKDQTVVIPCYAYGFPPPSYIWKRENGVRGHDIEKSSRINSVGEAIVIERVEPADSGMWSCTATSPAGQHSKVTTLHVIAPLSVVLQPAGQVIIDVGEVFELRCVVTGGQHPTISWLKDANPILTSTSNPSDTGDLLTISKVSREHAGMYQCVVRDEEESLQSSTQLILGASKPQLLYKFIQQTVQPGPAMSLKCIAAGNPTPEITWTLDGYSLPQNERFMVGRYVAPHGNVVSHVNISNVHVQDGGIYQCKASNRVGEVSHKAEMRVYGLPYIRPMPNISAVAGEPLYISCPAAGYPIDQISWEKDGKRLPLNRRQRIYPNGTLHITNVEHEQDRGSYRCSVQNKQGKAASQVLHMSVIVPPRIAPFVLQGDLLVGERVRVQCFVTKGDLPLELGWYKDTVPLVSGASDVVVRRYDQYTSSLSIDSLTSQHAGNYTCVATNAAATAQYTATLLVNVPPKWISEPKDVNVTKDGVAIFECKADGFPTPQTTWRKIIGHNPNEYQDLSVGQNGISVFPNGTMMIKPTLSEHEGQYLCEASNGIGAGISSTVSLNVHNPPLFENISSQESVRRGQSQTLTCEAHGDLPMTISWAKHPSGQLDSRYEIREKQIRGNLISELVIENTIKSDSGQYMCIATNPYGTAQQNVYLQVQDAPGKPIDVHVVDIGSRSAKVSWLPPTDEQNLPLQYNVQYKRESGVIMDEWESANAGSENHLTINNLHPANVYSVRVQAENHLGAGEPSDIIQITTNMEVPSGEAQGLTVGAASSTELTATWLPPPSHTHNGQLLGYYVGIREYSKVPGGVFNFTTTTASPGSMSLTLKGLHPFRKYGIVVQAFNQKGPGPVTSEFLAHTLEDVPSAAPSNVECSAQSSESILVTWKPPPADHHNGRIQGYRTYYENVAEYPPGFIEADTKSSNELSIKLLGLQKFANYSIEVWAFTKVGDGLKSSPIFCSTDEDVPDAPANIKVVSTSETSLIVSWLPPIRANGILTAYFVYWRPLEGGKDRSAERKRVPPSSSYFQLNHLTRAVTYEVWVSASTRPGEGQPTHTLYATPSNKGTTEIISLGRALSVIGGESVTLPCITTSDSENNRIWTPKSLPHNTRVLADGSLYIAAAQRAHHRNYTCLVDSSVTTDEIQYSLRVIVAPDPPELTVTGRGQDWLELTWTVLENGGSPVRGYILEHSLASSPMIQWTEVQIARDRNSFRLGELLCGTSYNLRMCAYNSAGTGRSSEVLGSRTEGGRPIKPPHVAFIQGNVSTITLNLAAWNGNGCPIDSFSIEYKEQSHSGWLMVGKNIQNQDKFEIVGLWPGKRYTIKVKVENSAGSTIGEYSFTTLQNLGVTLSPTSIKILSEGNSVYLEPNIILPILASLLTLVSIGVAITICFRRSRSCDGRPRNQPDSQSITNLENKANLDQREQYYAAVHKGMAGPIDTQCESIPEYPDDISPYATFHVAPQISTPRQIHSFLYHDQALAAMDTMPLKCSNMKEEYSKLRVGPKGVKCLSTGSDYSGSITDQWSEHGPHGPLRSERIHLHMYGGSSHAVESSSSGEQSPVHDARAPPKLKHVRKEETTHFGFPAHLEPPTGFTDACSAIHEPSEAECDRDSIHRLKGNRGKGMHAGARQRRDRRSRFTIAV